jgi:hypothetical protein
MPKILRSKLFWAVAIPVVLLGLYALLGFKVAPKVARDQAQAARDRSRADLDRAIQVFNNLAIRMTRLNANPDPEASAIREESFQEAALFAQQYLDASGPPEQWSPTELRVAETLSRIHKGLGQTETSQQWSQQARRAGDRLAQQHPDRADIVVPLAGAYFNDGIERVFPVGVQKLAEAGADRGPRRTRDDLTGRPGRR